ncbi:MAG TPA: ESX secretion-associated protein EspG, partial [Pseudonocardiaceae bacterium]|nr:ESX secretion-associated protein EspG [Pseudonocardiaceae bacterium]
TLALDTISTVWRRENLGEPHNIFVDTTYWLDEEGERQALQRAGDDMAMHGVLMGRDLSPDFREALEILARPNVEYFGWIGVRPTDERSETNIAVLAASVGQDGVLAIRDGDQATIGPCSADGLAEALVDKMPNVPPGRGRSVNLPEREMRQLRARRGNGAPGETPALPADAFNVFSRASMAEDARDLFAVLELPRSGGGELYAAARARSGERRRAPHPLVYMDTEQGRWMSQLSGDQPGDRWMVAAPASRSLLINKLHEMRAKID